MSASRDFFRERKAQAVFKHAILSRYPVVFASKAGRGRPVVFLDGYAGRGEYEDGTPGSPLLLAQKATRVSSFRQVRGIYVERNDEDYQNLKRVMEQQGRPQDLVLGGDLQNLLPDILPVTRGAALFAFLDPFGTALDRNQLVRQLLNRPGSAPTEVLLHISISTVARMGGLLRKRREEGKPLSVADEKTVAHANRFLGGDWWQKHFAPVAGVKDQRRATDAALAVAAEYQAGIRADARCKSLSMPIQHKPNQLPKYLLVLFTRHVDGLWWFADAVGKAGREWEGAWLGAELRQAKTRAERNDTDALFTADELLPAPEAFDVDSYVQQNRASWERIIEQNIQRLLTQSGPFVLADRLEEVYAGVFGAASSRHVRAAIKSLHRQHVVQNTGVGDNFHRQLIIPVRPITRASA
ncbi:three-Cys-motif partner protein TcmP [Amycolatopsis sp. NPDC050768]|uniref:three-Cys-motif partner protein TcmP n=1 Tax=Amycolatopsis sp. NPDC050768 TaxID=3154839 RepID=UPI0033D4BFFD